MKPAPSNDTAGKLREQVFLTRAMDRELTGALDELEVLHSRISDQEDMIRGLANMLNITYLDSVALSPLRTVFHLALHHTGC